MSQHRRSLATSAPVGGGGGLRGLVLKLCAMLGAVALLLTVAPATPAFAANGTLSLSVTITDASGNPVSVVDASQIGSYRVSIAYGCLVADCTGSVVKVDPTPTDPYYGTARKEQTYTYIPPFTPAPPLTGNLAQGLSIDLGTVTAGTNGVIRINYTVGNAQASIGAGNFFPDGSLIQPNVTMTSSSAATVTGTDSATWKSYIPTPTLALNPSATKINTDTPFSVRVFSNSRCWYSSNGVLRTYPYDLCGDAAQTVVDLPPNAQYVPGSGGTYDAATHSVTVTAGPKAWRAMDEDFQVTFPSTAYPTSGVGCVASETFHAHDASYTYLDGTTQVTNPATATATVTVGNCAPFAKASVTKQSAISGAQYYSTNWNIPTPADGPYGVYWEVTANNQANVPGVATIVDSALDQPDLPVTRIKVTTGGPADIQYTLDDGTTGTATGVTTTAVTAPAGRHFASVTATSSALAGPNVKDTDTGRTPFTLQFIATLSPGATPGTRTNTASATMTYPGYPELGTIAATGSPVDRTVTLANAATPFTITASNLAATVTGGGTALVGGEVTWKGTGSATNVVASTWTPQYTFLAPLGWDIEPNGASLATPVPGATFSYKTVTYQGNVYQAVVVNWPAPIPDTANVTLPQLSVLTMPTGAAASGTNNQTAHLFVGDAANGLADTYSAKVTDTTDIDADGVTTDAFSHGVGNTSLAASPGIGVTKEICKPDASASDGCDWLADSSVRVGVPPNATSIKYRLTVKNVGNAALTNAVAYDVLPYVGDTGTTTATSSAPRGSTVTEQLASVSDVDAGLALAYSTSTNPPRPEVFTGSTTGDWTAPATGASAIQATIASLAANQSKSFVYVASLVGGAADQVACNSAAVAATGLVAVEPTAVCATTQEADFSIASTDHLPLQSGRTGVVPFVVNNGGGSQSASGTVTISVPAEVHLADLTVPDWNCTAPSTDGPVDVTCQPVNADGTRRSLDKDVPETIALSMTPSESAPSQLCFDASVTGLMNDPELTNNTARSCSTTLAAEPQLVVSKDDAKPSVAIGEQFTYTISTASRLVAEAVDGVSLTDTLPAGLEFVSASPAPTTQSGQTLTWDLGRLEQAGIAGTDGDLASGGAGSSKPVSVTVRVADGTQDKVTNTATATGADPADSSVTLTAEDSDTDVVTNVFTDLGADESTPQNTPVTTPLGDIATTTGAPLDATLVTQATAPAHGSLTIDPVTGAVTFNPAPGYSGDDSYQVQVCDTTTPTPQCSTATAQVHVGVNVVAAIDDTAATDAGQPVTTTVRSNDTSQSGQALANPTILTGPADGSVVVNADGTMTYTPDAATSGPDSYTYRVCDTSTPTPVCDTATVAVDVANVWDVTGTVVQTPQNTPVTTQLSDIVTTQGAAIDPATVAQQTAPAHGSISVDPATGAVTYVPDPGYMGADSYELQLCDQGSTECSQVTVQVQVLPNVVTAVDDVDTTDAIVPVTTDVRGNDTSASGQPLADPTVDTGPAHGVAVVNVDGTITYTPDAGFSGADTYAYEVCDTSTPTAVCDTGQVTISVANVFTDLGTSPTTPHNTPVTTDLGDIVTTAGASLDPASVTEEAAPTHGSTAVDPATGAVTYTPEAGYAGPDSYEVRVCDTSTPAPQCTTATVEVTVEANVVAAVDDADATDALTSVTTDVAGNDTTQSGQPLADPTVTDDPGHGTTAVNGDGTITYQPAPGFSGVDSYQYQICDTSHPVAVCDTATVTITVSNVWTDSGLAVETPQNTPVTTPLADLVTTTGAPPDPTAVVQVTAPQHGSLTIDSTTGAATYTPQPGYAGTDAYTLAVCDTSTPDPECHQVTVPVTVLENSVAAPDLAAQTRAGQSTQALDLQGQTVSASGQPLDLPTISAQPQHGTVTVNADGTATYTPDAGYDGQDSFGYTVCDTSHPTPVCDTGTVIVTVTPVADLAMTKTVQTAKVVAGLPIGYQLTVTNAGPSTATQTHAIDPVPAAILDPVGTPDASITGASCETRPATQADLDQLDPARGPYTITAYPKVVDCTYPALKAGTTVHGRVTGKIAAGTRPVADLRNQAAVFATTFDPNAADNAAGATVAVKAEANLAVTKVADHTKVMQGDVVTFTVTVVNHGPSVATGVTVADTPSGLRAVSHDASLGTVSGSDWRIGRLEVGQKATLTGEYRVTGRDAANRAVASGAVSDPVSSDNADDVQLDVSASHDVAGSGDDDDVSGNALAETGNPVNLGVLGMGLCLVVAGAGLLLGRRRRSSQS